MRVRIVSWSNLARKRRRQRVAASVAAAGPDIWARRRPPKKAGAHGSAPETSQRTPATEGFVKPARNAAEADERTVTAADAPKRSTSTTKAGARPTAAAIRDRKRWVRASRDTPAK